MHALWGRLRTNRPSGATPHNCCCRRSLHTVAQTPQNCAAALVCTTQLVRHAVQYSSSCSGLPEAYVTYNVDRNAHQRKYPSATPWPTSPKASFKALNSPTMQQCTSKQRVVPGGPQCQGHMCKEASNSWAHVPACLVCWTRPHFNTGSSCGTPQQFTSASSLKHATLPTHAALSTQQQKRPTANAGPSTTKRRRECTATTSAQCTRAHPQPKAAPEPRRQPTRQGPLV